MLDFIKKFAPTLQPLQLVGLVVVVLVSTLILNTVFQYAKNRNLSWLITLEVVAFLLVLVLAFLGIANYAF